VNDHISRFLWFLVSGPLLLMLGIMAYAGIGFGLLAIGGAFDLDGKGIRWFRAPFAVLGAFWLAMAIIGPPLYCAWDMTK